MLAVALHGHGRRSRPRLHLYSGRPALSSLATVQDAKMPSILFSDDPLASVIAQIESSGRPGAFRFEPGAFDGHVTNETELVIARLNFCDDASARIIYASSFGLFQIMGFNLYAAPISWGGTILAYLNDSGTDQYWTFKKFLQSRGIDLLLGQLLSDPQKMDAFAKTYNGSLAYGDAIRATAKQLGLH
jgi:hypothetical protein